MAQIVAPSTPPPPIYIGKGYRGASGREFNIFGHYLPNNLASELANAGLTSPWQIITPTTLFDVSSLPINSEVPAFLYVSPNTIRSETTYVVNWYRVRDSTLVFTFTYTRPHPGEGMVYYPGAALSAWIGWLSESPGVSTYPLYKEIQENGIYRVTIQATGGESFFYSAEFAVVGIPPSLVLSNRTSSGFDWLIRVSNYFDTSNYIRAGICTGDFTDGQNYEPSGIVASTYATSSTLACVASGTITSPITSASTVYGFAQAANGLYYKAGSEKIISPFAWTYPKTAGGDFNLTAVEWNAFTAKINDAQAYKGQSQRVFTKAVKENEFKASMAVEAWVSLWYMNPPAGLPSIASAGEVVKASHLNQLVNALNSIK